MCKAALERFHDGLASEVYADGIVVNGRRRAWRTIVSTSSPRPERHEPVQVMAEAVYALATGDPATLTGKVTYAKVILDEVGKKADSAEPAPAAPSRSEPSGSEPPGRAQAESAFLPTSSRMTLA